MCNPAKKTAEGIVLSLHYPMYGIRRIAIPLGTHINLVKDIHEREVFRNR